MTEALFVADGDRFKPTELTRGGWSDHTQHGSPPSGLLARAVDLVPTAVPMQVVRFTVDLFRPVPMEPLVTRTVVRRDGKRIQVVDSYLEADGVEVGRVSALKIRIADLPLEPLPLDWKGPPPPADVPLFEWGDTFGEHGRLSRFHHDAVEIRSVDQSFAVPGPGLSWFRLLVPVIEGEEPSPFVKLATLADLSNGNSMSLDPQQWIFVNPDITLYAHRLPSGEWVGMRSVAAQWRTGIGMADTLVFDESGPLGRINQAQLLDFRSQPGT